MVRAMLDTMIFDLIAADETLGTQLATAIATGQLQLLTTHIQEDQLAAIPDAATRDRIDSIPRRRVATRGAVIGVSRVGQARIGTKGGNRVIEAIGLRKRGHVEDALIAVTAAREADVLVTEDQRLTRRAKAECPGLEVWGWEQFAQHARSL